jgi:hypothetical protein
MTNNILYHIFIFIPGAIQQIHEYYQVEICEVLQH